VSVQPPSRDYRASDADREATAERLRVASVEGRIDSDELEQRLADTYGARTVGELDRIVADIVPPPPPPAPVVYQPYPPHPPPVPATNGLAVASLVAGVMWIGWVGSVLAVIFGHIALKQIDQHEGREQGRGLTIAGLAFGYLGVATLVFVVIAAALSSWH
jgi:hypothetical protein